MAHPSTALLLAAALFTAVLPPRATAADVPDSVTGVDLREEHATRRAALARALPPRSLAIIPAEHARTMAVFSVRQDEDYGWLTGIDDPNGILLLSPPPARGKPHGEVLLLPPRNPRMEGWIGPRWFPGEEAEEGIGVAATEDVRRAEEVLQVRLRRVRTVLVPRTGGTAEVAEKLFGEILRKARVEVGDVRPFSGRLRLVKSAEEIARIRRSADLTAEGHRRAMTRARAGMPEFAVQAIIEEACREGGCRRQAYDSIVGSGPNSCILHYGANRRILGAGEVVLVDAGGEYLGYACDVTRTWPVDGKFTEEQGRVYDAVLEAQAAGERAAVPGATFREIAAACREVFEEKGYEAAIRHGPCHWVGRGVHDPNGSEPLRPGAVFTIEPGLYFPEKGLGVRIEDTYLVKEDGTLDCLSSSVPKDRAGVEALRAEALKDGPR
jgi:Xaa-Pro aminopeptidase